MSTVTSNRIDYLDGLRAIAATAVLAQHLTELAAPKPFAMFLDAGPGVVGVVLFFYISGTVVPLSVRKHPTTAAFALRRIFRIFPAYLATLLVVGIVAIAQGQRTPFELVGPWGTLANVLLVQDYFRVPAILGVTWTLSIELIWYGTFIVLWRRMRWLRCELLLHAFSAGLVVASVISWKLGVRFPAGRVGLLGAALCGYLTWQRQTQRASTAAYVVAVGSFLSAQIFALYVAFGVFSHPTIKLHHSILPWCAASILFFASANFPSARSKLGLTQAPVLWVGERSYSLYLLHVPICQVVLACLGPHTALLVVPVATLLTAALSFQFVELPGIRTGAQLEMLARRRLAD